MTAKSDSLGRVAQKRRTRKEIVAAAARLMAKGGTLSINDIATEADVSRRTVYMHFATLEQLLIDASLVSMTDTTIGAALDRMEHDTDVRHRVEVLTRAVQSNFASTEQQGRTLLKLTLDANRTTGKPSDQPVRGYRRVEWIERAIAPVRAQLTKREYERLVSALAMVIGWESLIVARDVRGLSLKDAENVSAWAAGVLVEAALGERGAGKRTARASELVR